MKTKTNVSLSQWEETAFVVSVHPKPMFFQTIGDKTFERIPENFNVICPWCHSGMFREIGTPIGKTHIACLNRLCPVDNVRASGINLEAAYGILTYNFEMRGVPSLGDYDTTHEAQN